MTKKGVIGFSVIGGLIVVGSLFAFSDRLSWLTKDIGEVKEVEQGDLSLEENVNSDVLETKQVDLPFRTLATDRRIAAGGKTLTMTAEGIMWNGEAGFGEGNGGEATKQGSFFADLGKEYKAPFMLKLRRQDNYTDQQDNLVLFAREFLKNGNTEQGAAITWFMGDNAEIYMTQLNNKLAQVAKELDLPEDELYGQIFLTSGYSYGEDKAMGLVEWKDDPTLALGQVFACYPQDGDQNLVIKWAADNGLLINPDGDTYCENAINFAFTDGFMEAARAWGTETGDRMVVELVKDEKTGELKTHKTGKTKRVKILGAATWWPGDEEAFDKAKREGLDLVSLYSTYDNAHQMPCVYVSINKFIEKNPGIFDAIVEGTVRAGDQMKVHDAAFKHAMKCMEEVYKERSADEWGKAFRGIRTQTLNGHEVILGGTRVCNLADNLDAFGIGEGARNTYQSSYELFGGFIHTLYPEYMPERLAFANAVELDPLKRVATKMRSEVTAGLEKPEFKEGAITEKVAETSYSIEFEVGSAKLTPKGLKTVEELFNGFNTNDLRITISGHTDNTGTDATNIPLSESRAQAVVDYLQRKSIASFPDKRFSEIRGFGSTMPIADNSTASGRGKNRRVEIIVGR